MYIMMGINNAKANLGRTLMAFFVIAAAAMILTASLSTASGFLRGELLEVRRFLGADIVILPGKLVLDAQDLHRAGTWAWQNYPQPWVSDTAGGLKHLPLRGLIGQNTFSHELELVKIEQAVAQIPQATDVYPYKTLPAFARLVTASGPVSMPAPLRARDLEIDEQYWPYDLFKGRGQGIDSYQDALVGVHYREIYQDLIYFAESAEEMVCMINQAAFPAGVPVPARGDVIRMAVPSCTGIDERGMPIYSYSQLHEFPLRVVGKFNLHLQEDLELVPWSSAAVHVPTAAWQRIATTVHAPLDQPVYPQIGLALSGTYSASSIVKQLREALPEYTVLTVNEFASVTSHNAAQAGMPTNLDGAFHLMIVLITSLIVAANAFLLIMQRRREIGILKALGASHVNIVSMVLTELVCLALMASVAGFAFYRGFYIAYMLHSKFPWSVILQGTWRIGWQVLGSLVLAATAFGLIPALKAAGSPVNTVLRDA